jgi:site-specific recombinase XerD
MLSASHSATWEEALSDFLLHLRATRADNTVRFYRVQLGQIAEWANEADIPLQHFGKRHLDRYIAFRKDRGNAPTTIHHDAVCAKAFLAWCVRNDLLDRSLLADYQVRKAPRPPKHMPTEDEMRRLLTASRDFWDPAKNVGCRFTPTARRSFYRERNSCALLALVDTACRVGEILALKVGDVKLTEKSLTVRESKGREPRTLPISERFVEALRAWLKVRERVIAAAGASYVDEGWLFITDAGGQIDEGRFLFAVKKVRDWAGLPKELTLHSIRRYSLNRLAKTNLLAAQQIAGHKETRTTLLYTQLDPDFVRAVHREAGLADGLLAARREKRRRLV